MCAWARGGGKEIVKKNGVCFVSAWGEEGEGPLTDIIVTISTMNIR